MLWPDMRQARRSATGSPFGQRLFLTNLDWALMTYSAIVGLSYALAYHRESQARALNAAQLETQLVEARLRTLEAELHPHFLFNTLHAISTLVHTKPDAADRMISRLSDLLRLTFDRSGAHGVSLQEELEFLQKYLEIEQTRFQDRLTVRFDIDPETLDAEVPRLILQPLVENAIKHGVAPRSGPGLVQIASRREDGRLWLEVSDNGVGLERRRARPAAQRRRPVEYPRSPRVPLRRRAIGFEFSDGGPGLAVRIEIPFTTRVRPTAKPSAWHDERATCASSSPTTSRSRASGCGCCSSDRTGSRSSPSATTAPSTIDAIGRLKPDLVFLDVQMPGATGFDVIEARRRSEQMPLVVFVTAFDTYALRRSTSTRSTTC